MNFNRFALCLRSLQGGYEHGAPREVRPTAMVFVRFGNSVDRLAAAFGVTLAVAVRKTAEAVRRLNATGESLGLAMSEENPA